MAAAGTPTHWDLYARPYYRCRIRVLISGTNSTLIYNPTANPQLSSSPTAGAITVKVIVLPDTSSHPDQILGFPDSSGTSNDLYTNFLRRRRLTRLHDLYQHRVRERLQTVMFC